MVKVKLVRACNQVQPAFNWEGIGEVICRRLGIAFSTSRDLKRLIRENRVSEVIGKLIECAKSNEAHMNVLGGFLSLIRKLVTDSLFARELVKQDVYAIIVRYTEMHPHSIEFRNVVIDTLSDLLKHSPNLDDSHRYVIQGTAKVARLIPGSTADVTMFQKLVSLIMDHLPRLNTYKLINHRPLPVEDLHGLELPQLANIMVTLLENRSPAVLLWDSLDNITIILAWIAYYQSDAILQMPENKGVLLFVAFMQCSSLSIRCRGFIGLLNLHYPDFAQDLRFCNPHFLDEEEAPDVGRVFGSLEKAKTFRPPEMSEEAVSESYHNPSIKELFGTNPFHAYEIAMRFVRYELEGPQSDKDLMPYLQKYLDDLASSTALFKDLDSALRFHQQEYEAEVLLLARFLRMYPILPSADDISDIHRFINAKVTANSNYCINRWPEMPYFYYAKVKSQTGMEYATVAADAAKLPDCSPYLSSKIFYELVVNLLGNGIVSMSMLTSHDRWEWPDTNSARKFFGPVHKQIMVAKTRVGSDSAEGQILSILQFVSALVSGGPDLGTERLEGPIPSIRENLQNLTAMKCTDHQETRNAVADYVQYRRRAAIRWSALILAIRRVEPAAVEGRKSRAREALEGGFLRTKSREEAFLALDEDSEAKRESSCAWCERASVALLRCSRCEKVKYCNAICQRKHWVDGHKTVCISPIIAV